MARYALAILAYVVPTFAIAFAWHLVLFEGVYQRLEMYRPEVIIPFGILSMLIQAPIFALLYDKAFSGRPGGWLRNGLLYAVLGGLLSWSFTTLAVAAKNVMTSVPEYLLIETAFTFVQWIVVGPLTALAFARVAASHRGTARA